MTSQQIAYWKVLEDERSHQAQEAENRRHNLETEKYSWGALGESARHNKESERISLLDLGERSRANRANEEIGRMNVALGYAQVAESARATDIKERRAAFEDLFINAPVAQSQIGLNRATAANRRADTQLKQAQTKTEDYKQTNLTSQTWSNWITSITGGLSNLAKFAGGVADIAGLAGSGGAAAIGF